MTRALRMLGLALLAGAASAIGSGRAVPPVDHGQAAHHSVATQAATGFHRGHSMRAMLTMSASVVGADVPAAAALEDGLGRNRLSNHCSAARPALTSPRASAMPMASTMPRRLRRSAKRNGSTRPARCAGGAKPLPTAPISMRRWTRQPTAERLLLLAMRTGSRASATPVERALTGAMVKRYALDPAADRAALDAAFADAMLAAAAVHPDHDDLTLLAAESAMNTRPWDYWAAKDKAPRPRIAQAVGLVKSVLARNPEHPQAAHLYIHLMEDGPDPKLAELAADRLNAPLAPASGHLVHMPAHIYFRLGRWKDSIRSNIAAARADEAWINASGRHGPGPLRLLSAQCAFHRHFGPNGGRNADGDPRSAQAWSGCSTLQSAAGSLGSRQSTPRLSSPPHSSNLRRGSWPWLLPMHACPTRPRCAFMPARSPAPSSATAPASSRSCAAAPAFACPERSSR